VTSQDCNWKKRYARKRKRNDSGDDKEQGQSLSHYHKRAGQYSTAASMWYGRRHLDVFGYVTATLVVVKDSSILWWGFG
jgi:hypothetical protein